MRRFIPTCLSGPFAACVLLAAVAQADFVVDFESYPVPAEGYTWGPVNDWEELPDYFGGENYVRTLEVGGGVTMHHNESVLYGSWDGFAISNQGVLEQTPGVDGEYAAYVTAPSKNTYAVGYVLSVLASPNGSDLNSGNLKFLPSIYIPDGLQIQSIQVTNNSYAVYSMMTGDGFAKKFGGDDGDDKDFYQLNIFGTDAEGNMLSDFVSFMLADYSFEDNALDYIVDYWATVDLSPLENARSLHFGVYSSDIDEVWGMNTPAYFAIDNLTFATAVPEPGSMLVLSTLLGGGYVRYRRKAKAAASAPEVAQ